MEKKKQLIYTFWLGQIYHQPCSQSELSGLLWDQLRQVPTLEEEALINCYIILSLHDSSSSVGCENKNTLSVKMSRPICLRL